MKQQISLGDGNLASYEAPELPDSRTLALLGRISMARLRMLLRSCTGVARMVGPGATN